jgi:hypothetical protein
MEQVLRRIAERKSAFAQRELFQLLKDERLSVRARLRFVPAMAHFIMSFSDLNRDVLRFAEPTGELEHAVNRHTAEDEEHWRWFLMDLNELGHGGPQQTASMLETLWSPDTRAIRRLTYTLIALVTGTDAAARLALIEVMEETGNVTFSALAPLASHFQQQEGRALHFCGDVHLTRETGHTMGSEHALLAGIELEPAARLDILQRVDRAFDAFDAFADELARIGRAEHSPTGGFEGRAA